MHAPHARTHTVAPQAGCENVAATGFEEAGGHAPDVADYQARLAACMYAAMVSFGEERQMGDAQEAAQEARCATTLKARFAIADRRRHPQQQPAAAAPAAERAFQEQHPAQEVDISADDPALPLLQQGVDQFNLGQIEDGLAFIAQAVAVAPQSATAVRLYAEARRRGAAARSVGSTGERRAEGMLRRKAGSRLWGVCVCA